CRPRRLRPRLSRIPPPPPRPGWRAPGKRARRYSRLLRRAEGAGGPTGHGEVVAYRPRRDGSIGALPDRPKRTEPEHRRPQEGKRQDLEGLAQRDATPMRL